MRTRFIYVRDEAPVVYNSKGERQKSRGLPLGCFAYNIVPVRDGGKVIGKTIKFGYSVFKPDDACSKHEARVVAEYRLLMDSRGLYGASFWTTSGFVFAMLQSIAESEIHQWAKTGKGKPCKLRQRFRDACRRTACSVVAADEEDAAKAA